MLVYSGLCPNCGGEIDEFRMKLGLLCKDCIPNIDLITSYSRSFIREQLLNSQRLGKYLNFLDVEEELEEFDEFFSNVCGKKLWSIQRSWARRMLANESFALIAPTGVGKTTLLLIYSLYRAVNGGRVLYIVPTRELMNHIYRLLSSFNSFNIKLYNSDNIKSGDLTSSFITVLTHNFIHRNKDLISNLRLNLVVVDDFDALLKTSSIVDLILKCIGVSDESISYAKKLVSIKSELVFAKYSGNEELVSKLKDELYQNTLNLVKSIDYSRLGQLLIASATGRGRGERVKILRELLGFEVGAITDYLRNLVEVYDVFSEERLKEVLNNLVGGTLVFVSKDLGLNYSKHLVDTLRNLGFRVALANSRKALDMLRNDEVDVVVGVSTYYGILTRGLDEPLRIYNIVFVGIPKNEFYIDNLLMSPRTLTYISNELVKLGFKFEGYEDLIRRLKNLSPKKIKILTYSLRNLIDVEGQLLELKNTIINISGTIKEFIKDYLRSHDKLVINDYVIKYRNGKLVVWSPDIMTYIQASGRSSRLYNGSMTLGLSIVLVDDEDLMNIFVRKLRNYIPSSNFRKLSDIDLNEVRKRQYESRSTLKLSTVPLNTSVKPTLIVVESPTKARTIASMFGKPGRRYLGEYVVYESVIPVDDSIYVTTIAPTYGHVTDLVVGEGLHGIRVSSNGLTPIYTSIKRCYDCGHQFTDRVSECPRCGSPRLRDSYKVIDILRKLAQEVDTVFIATDPDDEGEKIAYDIYLALKPFTKDVRRIEFHEVTRRALIEAIRNPRGIDMFRVNAQVVRRVDDRLVGFEVSDMLKNYFNKYWLGGGRVQTPVLGWVVSNYRDYIGGRGYNVIIKLFNNFTLIVFIRSKEEALKIVDYVTNSGVRLVKTRDEVRTLQPKPPYSTDDLLVEASNKLKLPAVTVMKLAQELFESGFITYHRTDSTHVSGVGVEVAKEYTTKKGISNDFRPRSWGGVGTHECIRPTKPIDVDELSNYLINEPYMRLTYNHLRLYDLIFRRFIASQLSEAEVKFSTYVASINTLEKVIEVPVSVLRYGFLKVYNNLIMLPSLEGVNEVVLKPKEVKIVRGSEVKLLTISDVVRLMKDRGIGRPSTYAKAIDNNVRHGYLIVSKRKLCLIPTKLGVEVYDILSKHLPDITSEVMTREIEGLLDAVRSNLLSRDEALTLLIGDVVGIRLRRDILLSNVQEDLITT